MFQFHNNEAIKGHRENMQAKMLGSFKSEDKLTKASLMKGLTLAEFDASFPDAQFEKYSQAAIEKFRDDLRKANENDLQKAEGAIDSAEAGLQVVVVQQGEAKKLVYVRKKA